MANLITAELMASIMSNLKYHGVIGRSKLISAVSQNVKSFDIAAFDRAMDRYIKTGLVRRTESDNSVVFSTRLAG